MRHLPPTDEEMDHAIMQGSPFAMPAPAPRAPGRAVMLLGDLMRGLAALGLVCVAVAGLGAAFMR